ncbi:MAG TPA: hypothetical protein VJG49_04400 [Candidatus Nanoarchaeia archaeon]|nr:hypothetical protein [Candidatus Nanoarchaeia archaeon]
MALFENIGYYLQAYGILDFLLPFVLVFTIVYAVMQKTKILGDHKNFNVIIALVLGLLFVVPHIMGTYPAGYDPVQVMNESLPSISLVAVAAIMLLLLMGIFGTDFSKAAAPFIAILSIIFVAYIFGSSLNLWIGPSEVFGWWGDELTELLIIILVFALVIWFIVREPSEKSRGGEMLKSVGKLFRKTGE